MKVALIDGFNLAFRAYYGMPELARKDGFPTGTRRKGSDCAY